MNDKNENKLALWKLTDFKSTYVAVGRDEKEARDNLQARFNAIEASIKADQFSVTKLKFLAAYSPDDRLLD